MQHAQWYMLRKLYGNEFWQEFAKQRPKGFDARAQLFDRLSKGDDRMCVLAEYAGYTLFPEKGADIEFVAPADGLPATSFFIGVVNARPIRRRPSSSWTGRCPSAARPSTRTRRSSSTGRCGPTRRPMPTGKRLADFKLLFPTDWNDYVASHPVFVKEWNAIMGL